MAPKEAPHPQETKLFMEYAGSLEAHEILARESMGVMTRKDVPKDVYDPVSARLRDESTKSDTVLEINCALSPEVAATEELERMRMILNPSIKKSEIKKLCSEIEIAAKGEIAQKFLFRYEKMIK